jgi:mannose-binding lectin 1
VLRSSDSGSAPVQQQQQQQQQTNQQAINAQYSNGASADDRPASDFKTSEQQFADLHNRLQLLNHATSNIYKELAALARNSDSRHREILQSTQNTQSTGSQDGRLSNMETRLQRIEQAIVALQRDAESKDYRNQFAQLHKALEASHLSLTEALQSSILTSKSSRVIPSPPD